MLDSMIEFKIKNGETILLRVSCIMALFPEQKQIRTTENGWTLDVLPECWFAVERIFRQFYLDNSGNKGSK